MQDINCTPVGLPPNPPPLPHIQGHSHTDAEYLKVLFECI